jgi:hypothetical protein
MNILGKSGLNSIMVGALATVAGLYLATKIGLR